MTSPFGKKVLLIALLTGVGLVVVIVLGVVVYFLAPGRSGDTRLLTPLAVLFSMGLGFGLLIYAVDLHHKNKEERRAWRRTLGVITGSEVEERQGPYEGVMTYHPRITYEYTVDGITYTGDQIRYPDSDTIRPGRARSIVNAYPVGATATVYYNPDGPTDSMLKAGRRIRVREIVLAGLLFLLIGAWAGVDWVAQILHRIMGSTP